MNQWETPDTIQTLLRYPDREIQVYFEGTFVNQRNKAMVEIMGTRGTMYLDRGRFEIHPEPGGGLEAEDLLARNRGARARTSTSMARRPISRTGLTRYASREQAEHSGGSKGVRACVSAHLANLAFRTGQVARLENLKRGGFAV